MPRDPDPESLAQRACCSHTTEYLTLHQLQTTSGKRYFPGLNGLRFFAVSVVILEHIEQLKQWFGFRHRYWVPAEGKIGVVLFFVLSGFLITYLLVDEKRRTGGVSLRRFYLRRILRIWPLYFLVISASLFWLNDLTLLHVPTSDIMLRGLTTVDVIMCFAILPHLVLIVIPYGAQTWSIGVEEQFYFFQPLAVKLIKSREWLFVLLVSLVFGREILSGIGFLVQIASGASYSWFARPIGWRILAIAEYQGCVAIGCIMALVYAYDIKPVLRFLFTRRVQLATYLSLLLLLFVTDFLKRTKVDFRAYGMVFSVIIVNVACNPETLLRFENRVCAYLGTISYGLYMYHALCIGIVLGILRATGQPWQLPLGTNLLAYAGTVGLTVGMSALSHRYFEGFFLNLKKRFER